MISRFRSVPSLRLFSTLTPSIEPWPSYGLDVASASTPPASWYTSKAVYDVESAVFDRWQFAGHEAQLPTVGSYITGSIADLQYLVCRSDTGLRAFHNVCRHKAAALCRDSQGTITGSSFVCFYHGWEYTLDGRLAKAPRLKGIKDFKAKDHGLIPLQLETLGDSFVFINHDVKARSLASGLDLEHTMLDKLLSTPENKKRRHIVSKTYPINCNWKVFVDNYLDGGYHVSIAHPELASSLALDTYTSHVYDSARVSIQTCEPSVSSARLQGSNATTSKATASYIFIYPNLMINMYGDWLDINVVLPTSHNTCQVQFHYFLHSDDDSKETSASSIEQSLEESERVQLEDVEICESVQRGLQSPGSYKDGRYAPSVEHPMFAFHSWLHQDLFI